MTWTKTQKELNEKETEYWLSIQKYRKCEGCLFFDATRKGKMAFCTYAFRLHIDNTTRICHTRKPLVNSGIKPEIFEDGINPDPDDWESQQHFEGL